MDPSDIVVPIVSALVAALGTLGAAYLAFRGKLAEVKTSSRQTEREADREAFDSIGERQESTIERLERRVSDLEADRDRLDRELGDERTKRQQLEVTVGRFRVLFRLLRQVILARCGRGVECPLIPLLDDWERETVGAIAAGANSQLAGGEGRKE